MRSKHTKRSEEFVQMADLNTGRAATNINVRQSQKWKCTSTRERNTLPAGGWPAFSKGESFAADLESCCTIVSKLIRVRGKKQKKRTELPSPPHFVVFILKARRRHYGKHAARQAPVSFLPAAVYLKFNKVTLKQLYDAPHRLFIPN